MRLLGRCSLLVMRTLRLLLLTKRLTSRRLSETFRHYFFRPQDLVAPEETTLDAHHNPPIVLCVIRGLIAHHTMVAAVDHFSGKLLQVAAIQEIALAFYPNPDGWAIHPYLNRRFHCC